MADHKTLTLAILLAGCSGKADTSATDTGDGPLVPVTFGFPVADRGLISTVVGVDHDPTEHTGVLGGAICTSYDGRGFPHCYDGHDGSDFMLDGGFDTMDAGSVEIVAAAEGVVVETEDGHYDRCHADIDDPSGVSCDGHDGIANSVILEHADGIRTLYWHMMQDSVAVSVGDEVSCGDVLGLIGSSGYSSAPHLHFEVQFGDGSSVDPYAGEESQPESWWQEQGDPDDLPGDGCAG